MVAFIFVSLLLLSVVFVKFGVRSFSVTVDLQMIGVPCQTAHLLGAYVVKRDWIITNLVHTLQTIHEMISATHTYSKLALPINSPSAE